MCVSGHGNGIMLSPMKAGLQGTSSMAGTERARWQGCITVRDVRADITVRNHTDLV